MSRKDIDQTLKFLETLNKEAENMAIKITSGKIATAKKVVIYGPEGIGKSTLASQFPEPVFIDTEGSTKELDVARYPTPASWHNILDDIDDAIDEIPCKTLVIDTADWAEQLCNRDVCKRLNVGGIEDIGYGKGYTYAAEEFAKMLNICNKLIAKGVNVVFTAHAQMRKFEQPDEMGAYDRWELKLSKKSAPLLKEWSDMLLFCNYKTNVVTDEKTKSKKAIGGKRVMYATHSPVYDAKNRFGLPDVMEMDFSEIAHVFKSPEDQKAEVIKQLRAAFKEANIAEDDVMAYLDTKGVCDGVSLEDVSLKNLSFILTNVRKIIEKLKEG